MTATHTPGPWNVGTGWIYAGAKPKGAKFICEGLPISAEGYANAHLIAAAPELLEALRELVELFDPDTQSLYSFARAEIEAAQEAINKATS